ncbi:fumarate hydratase, alpha subunit [Chitinivibrio alkaliphilus ACht1]|uniref:Fumarate hydratase, alpha subunit n=1 Tax=Chitinivibrio alkaliphilus ACht1 TaxID=1313304 RepID=U7D7S6_9BACT|nr:fumarate hydratase [Chitinivibrio alkaliphilus]ERP31988.1 fumarate hydratase, alpha subunit [Chitinivibrio alkaliphilus ACht1]
MDIRMLSRDQVVSAVRNLCLEAARYLPADVLARMEKYAHAEKNFRGRAILEQCIENARIAAEKKLPICQDTGFAVLFVEMGTACCLDEGSVEEACQEGVRRGYTEGYLRKSIVHDPLFDRVNTNDNTPAVIHLRSVPGKSLRIVLAPKGGGSENMSRTAMLKPADGVEGVRDFVFRTVVEAGGNPCPPTIVGVGLGGTLEQCCLMAKKSLLRPVGTPHEDPRYARLEQELLEQINSSGVGPQGLGGRTTALAVHITPYPCHIAQLPVAVNLNCHAARHAEVTL